MLNIYKFHNQPHILYDYENHWKDDPMAAVHVLVRYPDREDVKSVVFSDPQAKLAYVKLTNRPIWFKFVQDLIDSAIAEYNENAEAMADEDWDDEDEEPVPYEPIEVQYQQQASGESFGIYKSSKLVGSYVRTRSGQVKLLDLNDQAIATLDLDKTEDELWDDVYRYIYDVIVIG